MRKSIVLLCVLLGCLLLTACGSEKKSSPAKEAEIKPVVKPAVAVFTTNMGSFEIELAVQEAPVTCANFIKLVKSGFYKDVTFHRVIDGFMIQSGDPTGTGRGGPGYTIKDEFSPKLKHNAAGILSMANAGPNTGGSQFFITLAPTPWLDGKHAIFGKVTKGLEVVRKIGKVKTGAQDKPLEPVVIKSIEIKGK